MNEYDLKKKLKKCTQIAKKGYKLSMKQYKTLSDTLNRSGTKIESVLVDVNKSQCYVSEASEILAGQLAETREMLQGVSVNMYENIEKLRENLLNFSITLFGRTMAGKSTLMEVLTEGDGESIGKGAQRTTRDIRTYTWNNLKITDVPGIGAFEGDEDENIAFYAARDADLILFLITDDAPQAAEAECLGRIIELGKPVICVLNVKSSIREGENPQITLRNIERAFNLERLDVIKKQFSKYASLSGEIWDDIPVVSVHLKAAFISQKCNSKELAKSLLENSHIDDLKRKIIEDVKTHGNYYREKNFIDIVSVDTLGIFENFLFQANANMKLGKSIRDKENQLRDWNDRYNRDASAQIISFVAKIENDLTLEIPTFAEEHFDDKNVEKAWEQILIDKKIDENSRKFAEEMTERAADKLNELARSIENELKYTSSILMEKQINIPAMHKIIDVKKAWNWGSIIAGGGLSIAGGILFLVGSAAAGPVGWAALGVSAIGVIGSLIFKNVGNKEEKARKELEKKLTENVSKICVSLKKQLETILEKTNKEKLNPQAEELARIGLLINTLVSTQSELAVFILPQLMEQNKQIFTAALRLVFGGLYSNRVINVARLPGRLIIGQINEGKGIPRKKLQKLKQVMQEDLEFISFSSEKEKVLTDVFGENLTKIEFEDTIIHITLKEENQSAKNKVRIAEQFLGKYIEC